MIAVLRVEIEGVKTALAGRMAYRGDFLISALMTLLTELIAPAIIFLVYRTGASFPGWNLYEVLLIQGIVLLAKGIAFPLFFGMVWNTLDGVREGTFDLLLIKPRSVLLLSLAMGFNIDDLGLLLSGLVVSMIALLHLPPPSLLQWGQFCGLLLISVLVLFGFALLMAGSVFKWVGNSRVYEIFDCVATFGLYPKTIFSKGFQSLITMVVPIAMIGFFPAAVLLGKAGEAVIPGIAVALFFFGLGWLFWRAMLRNYTSAGG